MDIVAIRRRIIIALVSDDELMRSLVLKGGNALALIHGTDKRSSLDLDFSIEGDFPNPQEMEMRMRQALERDFHRHAIDVFDFKWSAKPRVGISAPDWWGGYRVEFKLVPSQTAATTRDIQQKRNSALTIGPTTQHRTFKIDISKHEYIAQRIEKELDYHTVLVYSLAMIAAEKIRAICQQMPEYGPYTGKSPRPRDFFDIHSISEREHLDLAAEDQAKLLSNVFEAKRVETHLISRIPLEETYRFHSSDWASVKTSANPEHDFRFYFDFVSSLVSRYNHRG